MSEQCRQQRSYDYRLKELVRETRDLSVAIRLDVPRSTAEGWVRARPRDVVTLDVVDLRETQLQFSNFLVEAFWRQMKHQWLFLNTLDSVAAVGRHVSTYVAAHNGQIPHSAFRGQTPDEMYFGRGADVLGKLAVAKRRAQEVRLDANRAASCEGCVRVDGAASGGSVEAV